MKGPLTTILNGLAQSYNKCFKLYLQLHFKRFHPHLMTIQHQESCQVHHLDFHIQCTGTYHYIYLMLFLQEHRLFVQPVLYLQFQFGSKSIWSTVSIHPQNCYFTSFSEFPPWLAGFGASILEHRCCSL